MLSGKSAVSTTHERSFAGLVMAHLAVTLVVCGGLVLLLPTPALSQGLSATISPIAVIDCDASARSARDYQVAADAGKLSAPDSDDDDDDDDAPTGPDVAIAVDQCRSISDADVLHVVHVKVDAWISRSVDGHSLRGPPADDDTSSDADFDGDDNDPTAEFSVPLPPPTDGESCPFTLATFVGPSSVRSTGSSLRAPPCSFSL
jgi:hypothetical protein